MTTTARDTYRDALDRANPNELADLLRQIKLGSVLTPLNRDFTITASATLDVTAKDAAGEVVGASNPKRKAILAAIAVQVTASGTAGSLGAYLVADAGATPKIPVGGAGLTPGICTLSDDGKTLTFPNTVTGVTVQYVPRAAVTMTDEPVGTAP